jgi:cytochrome c oxidase cbb3-type subunit 3
MTTNELRDHTFDGIHEFDSRLPNWWLWSFYLACIFSVFYWIYWHTLGTGDTPYEAYLKEQRAAAERMEAEMEKNPVTEASLVEASQNPEIVAAGKRIFTSICYQCHGPTANGIQANGTPGAGPNLTDAFWINGGTPMEIYNTVMNGGRPDKGMQSWKGNGPLFVQRAVAYVLSIRNTNVAGKPPEPEAKELK